MKGNLVLRHRVVAAGLCLILVGVLLASLVWAVDRASPPAAETSPASAQAEVMAGSQPAPFDPAAAERAVAQAWEKARDAGAYSFATQISQLTYPAHTLSNAGRSPERSELSLAGTIDQPGRTLEFRMWQPGADGSGGATSGVEARVEADRAYVRQAGGEWQEVQDFSSSFAPDNDPLSFLAGIKDVGQCGLKARAPAPDQDGAVAAAPTEVACYRFDIDGPEMAAYLQQRVERQMAEEGGVPAGVSVEMPAALRDLTGNGELWVDGRGLPLRLSIHLAFPADSDGSHTEADVQTEFSGYPEEMAASTRPDVTQGVLGSAASALGLDDPSLPQKAARTAGAGGVAACSLGALALLVVYRRSRKMYIAVAIAVTLSMLVVPLLQSEQVAAYYDRQAARSQELLSLAASGQGLEAQPAQGEEAAGQVATGTLSQEWNPQQDPLQADETTAQTTANGPLAGGESGGAVPAGALGATVLQEGLGTTPVCLQQDTDDADGDGVNNYQECVYFTSSAITDNNGDGQKDGVDSDNDGLTDAQELDKLGTNPILKDTDGDGITDKDEVKGFTLPGRSEQWYLDPNNPDSDGDGQIDSTECPYLVDTAKDCDTDGDGVPNPFDLDSDADGVPDMVDLSPYIWADSTKVRTGPATSESPLATFDGSNPFKLALTGLSGNWPVLVDVQFRPVEAAHLGYAMNVLDWPTGDVDGQIQHGDDDTFANNDNPDLSNPDDAAGANGDMRLVPLLEIVMTGSQMPLKVTDLAARATVDVGSGSAVTSTVKLTPANAGADTQVQFLAGATLAIYDGICPPTGAPSGTPLKTFSGGSGTWAGKKVVDLADGNHAAVVTLDTSSDCATLPDVVTGPYASQTKMIDPSALEPYGITVKDGYKNNASAVVAYVPLEVITDDTGTGKTAFQARMPFWTGGSSSWTDPPQMRVVWLVQMLTDVCADTDAAMTWEEYKAQDDDATRAQYDQYLAAYCRDNRAIEQIQPVQMYDESWYLTGLSVQEAHGLDVAVAYAASGASNDDNLWTMSWGLAQQFLPGRNCLTTGTDFGAAANTSCTKDDYRDLTVYLTDSLGSTIGNSTIQQRFDSGSNSGVHNDYRWGIPNSALVVKSYRFAHQDYVGYLATVLTPRILNQFTDHALKPTLLYAYEERSRLGNLADVATTAMLSGMLSFDLADTTAAPHPEQTVTGMKWATFKYNSTAAAWESQSDEEYWNTLETDLKNRFNAIFGTEPAATTAGRVTAARSYAVALNTGVQTVVCTAGQGSCSAAVEDGASDLEIRVGTETMKGGMVHASMQVLSELMNSKKQIRTNDVAFDQTRNALAVELEDNITAMTGGTLWNSMASRPELTLFAALGDELTNSVASGWQNTFTSGPAVGGTAGVVTNMAVSSVIANVRAAGLRLPPASLRQYVSVAAQMASKVASIAKEIYGLWKEAGQTGKTIFQMATSKMGFMNNMQTKGQVLGAVVAALTILKSWAKFAVAAAMGALAPGSMAFDEALVSVIAETVVAIVLFVVTKALGSIGTIIMEIVAILDLLAATLCDALLTEQQRQKEEWTDWVCGGVTGFLEQAVKQYIYSGTIMVDMDPYEDDPWYPRLNMHGLKTDLIAADQDKGMRVGSHMTFQIGLTNTIQLVDVPFGIFEAAWAWQFNRSNLGNSNFAYKWQTQKLNFHDSLELGGMSWDERDGLPFHHSETVANSPQVELTRAGINVPFDSLYLSEAYAVPEQECWGLGIFKVCYVPAEKATIHYDLGVNILNDVFPKTLTEFYQLAVPDGTGKGFALAWGQTGELKFPVLKDADGDGLPFAADPNDTKWDTDGDGLGDLYELNNGIDPLVVDSDSDGLRDDQEVRLGTEPRSPDSDGDGLYDCEEVFHQILTVGDSLAQDRCGNTVGQWSGGWDIVYEWASGQPVKTHVTSNALVADTDGDAIADRQEYVYGYNPRVYSVLNVLTLKSVLTEGGAASDGFVAPGATFGYNATVKNELDSRRARGLLWTLPSDVLHQSPSNPVSAKTFDLWPLADKTMAGDLVVDALADTGTYTMTQAAGALIVNPEKESGKAILWLPFDDATGSTSFADESGYGHNGRCEGTGCTAQPAAGRIGGAVQLVGSGAVLSGAMVPGGPYGVSLWFKTQAADGTLFNAQTTVSGTDRVQVYMSSGKVCAKIPGDATGRCSIYAYNDNTWHHLVHTDGGSAVGEQIVYVDGAVAVAKGTASSTTTWTSKADVRIGGKSGSYLVGSIDDVRLFDGKLLPAQVQDLYNTPIFHMDFNDTSAWKDVTGSPATITAGSYPPAHVTQSVLGGAASFDGTTYLSVGGTSNAKLNLSGGRFSLAAWIYPETRPLVNGQRDTRDDFPQGILGFNQSKPDAYPTLARVGNEIAFGLGTGAAGTWKVFTSTNDVLTENQWNHVVVTFDKEENDGTLRLYVNGTQKQEWSDLDITSINPGTSFDIGRANKYAKLSITQIKIDYPGDGWPEGDQDEHLTIDGVQKWSKDWAGNTEHVNVGVKQAVTESVTLDMWEDDSDQPVTHGSSDDCTWSGQGNVVFSASQPGTGTSTQLSFKDCGEGHLDVSYWNVSIPFYGDMDEVQIFARPLDPDSVKRLFLDVGTVLHLPLDEAPGASTFQDTSLPYIPASCSGSACPALGVPGRLNHAALFDSAKNNVITLAHSQANEMTNSFTVAAWINRNAVNGVQRIVSTVRKNSADKNGWGFGLSATGQLTFEHYGYETWTTSATVPTGGWTHVAAVVNADKTVSLYINGQAAAASQSGTLGGAADATDDLLVGAGWAAGASAPGQYFGGRIDDVSIFSAILPPERIQGLYGIAPILHLRFDEASGATQFADDAGYNRFATCTPGSACPLTGEAVRGQMSLAARFDGTDDYVNAGSQVSLANRSLTVSFWAKRDQIGKWDIAVSQGTDTSNLLYIGLMNDNIFRCSFGGATVDSPQAYTDTGWNHWACTYQKGTAENTLTLYRNGAEVANAHTSAVYTGSGALNIGRYPTGTHYFKGSLDEVQIYDWALTAAQIDDRYLYESAWFEDRQSQQITVDHDSPTAEPLIQDGSFVNSGWNLLAAVASDPTSGVGSVQLRIEHYVGLIPMSPCPADSGQPEGAWCCDVYLNSGTRTISAVATDRVGNTWESSSRTVNVDVQPPFITMDQIALQSVRQSTARPNTWVVHLSGTIQDQNNNYNSTASGVPPDGMHVTLRQKGDPESKSPGEIRQTATITQTGENYPWYYGGVWSLDYELSTADVNGAYDVVVEAVDRIAVSPGASPQAVIAHTSTLSRTIVLDSRAPRVVLDDEPAIAGGQLGPAVTSLAGTITERPVEVRLELASGTGADKTQLSLACQQVGGSWYTVLDLPAGFLQENLVRREAVEVHQGSGCRLSMATSAATAEVSGALTACGEPIASIQGSFSGSKTVDFVADSASCPQPVGQPFPMAGKLLHLPFDTSPATDGTILPDASGSGNDGTLHTGDAANKAGTPGYIGPHMLILDGTDDYVNVGSQIDLRNSSFTVAFWAKRQAASRDDYVVSQGTAGTATLMHIGFKADNKFRCSFYGNDLDTPLSYPELELHHWACTYDLATNTRTIYRDGVELVRDNPTAAYRGSGNLYIGQYATGIGRFRGYLDDVRIYPRALTAGEIGTLDIAGNLRLHLPLDTSPATNGMILPDASPFQFNGTLVTGAGDTADKATAGQVGSHALTLDGLDDYVSVGRGPWVGGATTWTIAFWAKRNALNRWDVAFSENGLQNSMYNMLAIGFRADNYFTCSFNGDDLNTPLAYTDTDWHHWACRYDGNTNTRTIYRDGVQVAQNIAGGDYVGNQNAYVGRWTVNSTYFQGSLDDVRIYEPALEPYEIALLAGYRGDGGAFMQAPDVAGVQAVDVAFTPVLPGSAFLNEVPWANEVLHLPFEDSIDRNNKLTFRDVSGAVDASGSPLKATCSDDPLVSCPTPGQPGPSGNAAWFDGAVDYVNVGSKINLANSSFTVAFWAKRDTAGRYEFAFSQGTAATDNLLHLGFRSTNIFTCAFYGNHDLDTPDAYTDTGWHHWACTFDKGASGNTRTIYRDGVAVTHDHPTYTFQGSGDVYLGRVSTGGYQFKGSLDDVRIFTVALTADKVRELYRGTGPMLALPFQEPWATEGASLPDASGWEHNGTLHTADTANKAVTGQVGTYALSFDGTDDYVNAGNRINLANASFSVAFWAKRDAAGRSDIVASQGTAAANNLLHVGFRGTDKFTCAFYSNDLDTTNSYTDTGWHHWACTFDKGANGNTRTIYRDGVEVAHDHPTYTFQGSGDLYIGRYLTNYLKGGLDDVRVYPRALRGAEVADLYHAGWQAGTLPPNTTGAESVSWTATVPGGLEGTYQVEMRGTDIDGHVSATGGSSPLWRGEADNLPPRVMLTRASVAGKYQYTTMAEDYHLVDPTVITNTWAFASPCGTDIGTLTKVSYQSPWYLGTNGAPKLFRLTTVCTTSNASAQATVCDSLGNCNTCDSAGTCTPSVTAAATLGSLQAGAEGASSSAVKAGKPPVKPGPALFEISAVEVVTTTQYYEPRIINLSGLVTSLVPPGAGEHDLVSVQVAIGGETGLAILSEPAAQRPYTVTWTFPWRLAADSELPDSVQYTAIITATDQAGRTKAIHHTLTADVVLPTPVTLSLTANGLPVEPGAIIRQPQAQLELTWTPSSDGSGLAPYLSGWRFEDAYTPTIQIGQHDPTGPLVAQATAGEAQRIGTGVASRDLLGNTRVQAFGSVIVDGPLTPDYIAFSPGAEDNLISSTCTLLGADRRLARREGSGRWPEQRLYGTWDHQALRLAWTGADWTADGDLFIYLDTDPGGGTSTTFTPYTVPVSDTLVSLPAGLAADVLVWVQDSTTASLRRWDGTAWMEDTLLSPDQYRFEGALNQGQTDLYLPLELLGTAQDAPLGLVAFAAEEPVPDAGLKIWATLPRANPVNSDRANIRRVLAPKGITMPLLRAYRWAALSDDLCPNGTSGALALGRLNDAVLDISVETNPPGATIDGLAGGLFWVPDPRTVLRASGAEPQFGFLSAAHPPVPDGQVIDYTVTYRNEGSHTLEDAWLAVSSHGAMQRITDTVTLGDIPPGGEGTITFQRTVDRSQSAYGLAAVLGRLYAAGSGEDTPPLEWLVALHRVDRGAPEEMGFERPELLIGPAAGRLGGFARDESGVTQVEIEITAPSGVISTKVCQVADETSGGWSCLWDATAANGGSPPLDGQEFSFRIKATDRLGYTSPWSAPQAIRVDALPPTVTLGISPGQVVGGNALALNGVSLDNNAVGSVTVCLDDTCRTADLLNAGANASGWSRWLMAPGAMDYVTKTLTIQAADRLGNVMTQTLSLPVTFDNVPPVLYANQVAAQVPLGSVATVLSGDVSDGSPEVAVSVRVQPPEGDVTRVAAMRNGPAWWFDLPADMTGQYVLWADAQDVAANVTTAGPFTVTVTCTDAALSVASMATEPVAGSPLSLTVTVVISNAGPDAVSGDLPMIITEGYLDSRRVTTTLDLPAGGSQALSFVWTPDGAPTFELGVTPQQVTGLPNGPLCVAPGTTTFSLPLRDQLLVYGWSLISPALNPANPAADVVTRGIDGLVTAILGYDGQVRAYYPDDPGNSDLAKIDALHGYWIHTAVTYTVSPTATMWAEAEASWRMVGDILPEDRPLSLAEGWNLVSYLPREALTAATALAGIDGQYAAVLGFQYTAASYYPDLDPSYNTLSYMAPGYGYWISATHAVALAYPVTTISNTVPVTATVAARDRLFAARTTESLAGVQPTVEWMNFYGQANLSDGTPVPTGTVVLAVDPDGIICGATAVWQPGQFGLLACYADDPNTVTDEGAVPGDTIQLFVSSDGTQPDGQLIGTGVWTAHGSRWEIGQEVQPVVDLAIAKAVVPQAALPGATITYTLAYGNVGNVLAQGVVLSDVLPAEIVATGYTYSGAVITPTASSEPFVWQVADLEPGAGGIITVTAVLSPALTGPLDIANTATISAPLEAQPEDNVAQAVLQVLEPEAPPPVVDLVIAKAVAPQAALPGETIAYILRYWNAGDAVAQGVVINDAVPAEIAVTGAAYSGVEITPVDGGQGLAWQVADLEPGASGTITITALLSPELTGPLDVTNMATINAPLEAWPEDNVAEAVLQVSEVEEAPPAVVDLAITKEVLPQEALPGMTITYTLRYWNAGGAMAQGVAIHDALPVEIEVTGITYSGAEIVPVDGGEGLVWQVADLAPGAGGTITMTAVVSPALTGPLDVTNTAIITAPGEAQPEDNVAEAVLQVIQGLASLWRLLVRGPL